MCLTTSRAASGLIRGTANQVLVMQSPGHSAKERLSKCLEKGIYISSWEQSMNDSLFRRTAAPGSTLQLRSPCCTEQRIQNKLESCLHHCGYQEISNSLPLFKQRLPARSPSYCLRSYEAKILFFRALPCSHKTRQLLGSSDLLLKPITH